MKKIIVAIASVVLTSISSAATINFSPATLSVARAAASSDITVQILGDFSTRYVEAFANINLDAFSIYQIQSVGGNSCLLNGGKLWVMASVNQSWSTPFPANQYTAVCKLKVRPRSAAGVGGYSLFFSNVFGYDGSALFTSVNASSATVTVTP
jgi:hypothetical protein